MRILFKCTMYRLKTHVPSFRLIVTAVFTESVQRKKKKLLKIRKLISNDYRKCINKIDMNISGCSFVTWCTCALKCQFVFSTCCQFCFVHSRNVMKKEKLSIFRENEKKNCVVFFSHKITNNGNYDAVRWTYLFANAFVRLNFFSSS